MELTFYLSSLIAIFATVFTIIHFQPVHALLYLIVSLLAVSCVFFSLGDYFAGAMEVIIYAGAIMVLFIFVIMVINVNINQHKKENNAWAFSYIWIITLILSVVFITIISYALFNTNDYICVNKHITTKDISIALFGPYLLIVEMISMLLLAGLVVAFHLGKDDRKI